MRPIYFTIHDDENLKNYYTNPQLFGLMGFNFRMQAHRWLEREGIQSYAFERMTLYPRAIINDYLYDRCETYKERTALTNKLLLIPAYDIRTREWWPQTWITKNLGADWRDLHVIANTEGLYPTIRYIRFLQMRLWYKEDVIEWMKMKEEARLKREEKRRQRLECSGN